MYLTNFAACVFYHLDASPSAYLSTLSAAELIQKRNCEGIRELKRNQAHEEYQNMH